MSIEHLLVKLIANATRLRVCYSQTPNTLVSLPSIIYFAIHRQIENSFQLCLGQRCTLQSSNNIWSRRWPAERISGANSRWVYWVLSKVKCCRITRFSKQIERRTMAHWHNHNNNGHIGYCHAFRAIAPTLRIGQNGIKRHLETFNYNTPCRVPTSKWQLVNELTVTIGTIRTNFYFECRRCIVCIYIHLYHGFTIRRRRRRRKKK